jgi:hypothetical protein
MEELLEIYEKIERIYIVNAICRAIISDNNEFVHLIKVSMD